MQLDLFDCGPSDNRSRQMYFHSFRDQSSFGWGVLT